MNLLAKKSLSLLLTLFLLAPYIHVGPVSAAAPVGIITPGSTSYPGGQMNTKKVLKAPETITGNGSNMHLDEANGYLYTILYSPSTYNTLYKLRLSDKSLVDTLDLPGVGYAWTSDMSADKRYIYIPDYCSAPTPAIHKVDTYNMSIVGTYTLPGGECIAASILDEATGFGYFFSDDAPSSVFKINLSTMTLDSSLTLNAGEEYVEMASYDPVTQTAYAFAYTDPVQVVSINTATMTRIGATAIPNTANPYAVASKYLIDGKMYLSSESAGSVDPAKLTEITASDMSVGNVYNFSPSENQPFAFFYHEDSDSIYAAGSEGYPIRYIKRFDRATLLPQANVQVNNCLIAEIQSH